ncbi:hypothetical protein GCM10009555_043310 [Acrocarpospora macrocephala]|uniref:Histidine kinase/HSP90-like ATPase domain-containing protein n=1 Tax=Acrocarpospora macrocephala TaxID=150177 RepID=A0A5M3WDV1_9ACTN|nr:ATP-binding protein [Acrocarpospora macrocephala]GES07006.1 hypothetical protein Amac_006010 [Acrocarpospora macrocephala]
MSPPPCVVTGLVADALHAADAREDTASAVGPHAAQLSSLQADHCRIRVTAWSLPRRTAARRARHLLRAQLHGHVTDPAVLEDLDVVVCELATNSARHTSGPFEMRVLHHAGVPVVCEVADSGQDLDQVADHLRRSAGPAGLDAVLSVAALAEGGRGLGIVATLTGGRCGVHATRLCGTGRTGKSVWFAIPVERAHTP